MDLIFVIFIIAFVLLTLVFGGVLYFVVKKKQEDLAQSQAIKELKDAFSGFSNNQSSLQLQFMDHLASQLNSVRSNLDTQLSSVRTNLDSRLNEVRTNLETSSSNVIKEARLVSEGLVGMREALQAVHQKVESVTTFQEIFKSPKLRGNWGEASLEHLLSQYYPKELYELQFSFSSGEKADAVFKLPNGKLLAIDSKFPLENYSKLAEAQTDPDREVIQKTFVADVKARVDEIAKKYILPSESTLDYAIMYVPAEAVYYSIVNPATKTAKDDLISYAWGKKVIISSPNLFYLTLKTIEHWFHDAQVSRQTQEILKRFEKIRKDAEKLTDDFRVLGKHLNNAESAYGSAEKRVALMSNKIFQLTSGKLNDEEVLEDSQIESRLEVGEQGKVE